MAFNWHDRESHNAVLRTRLGALRALLSSDTRAAVQRTFFDEYLEQNEFGLAFDTLVDFLLESDVAALNEEQLSEIAALYTLMELQDDALLRLRDKRENCRSADEAL